VSDIIVLKNMATIDANVKNAEPSGGDRSIALLPVERVRDMNVRTVPDIQFILWRSWKKWRFIGVALVLQRYWKKIRKFFRLGFTELFLISGIYWDGK
jgi:hypothetical protein